MRGSIIKRYDGSYSLVVDQYVVDRATGARKRKQRWVTFHGTKKEADDKLAEMVRAANRNELVEPTKLTFGGWLDDWLIKSVHDRRAPGTYEAYKGVVENHLKPKLGAVRLQALTSLDLEAYYASLKVAPATAQQHHAIVHSALAAAARANLVTRNVATLVTGKPRARDGHQDVLDHCWQEEEARAFLRAAKSAGPQPAAFYSFALDTGARKGELCGLLWADLDVNKARVTIQRQLLKPGAPPQFGPVKNRTPRTVDLSAETVELLKRHKAHQSEVKLANRQAYHDYGLVFAKDWDDLQRHNDVLGDPLQKNNLGQRQFEKLIRAAGVRRIKFHGLSHTAATLLLQAGVAPHIVQHRLGHKRIEMTLGIYAHALPTMQQDAAAKLAALLHG